MRVEGRVHNTEIAFTCAVWGSRKILLMGKKNFAYRILPYISTHFKSQILPQSFINEGPDVWLKLQFGAFQQQQGQKSLLKCVNPDHNLHYKHKNI